MARECAIFDLTDTLEEARRQRATLSDPFVLYVDEKCWKDLNKLFRNPVWVKFFRKVLISMMSNRRGRPDLYALRDGYDIWVMKISTRPNSRLLCREFGSGRIVIIAAIEENKTTFDAITKKNKGMYDSVASYTYNNIDDEEE